MAVIGTEEPEGDDAAGWTTWIGREVVEEAVLRVAFTTATTPSPIVVVFIPNKMQTMEPVEGLQEIDLPALVATDPAATVMALKSLVL